MKLAITFRTHQFLGDRVESVEFPISEDNNRGINETLVEIARRIERDYLPLIRDRIEYDEHPEYKLTDEIVIKIVK